MKKTRVIITALALLCLSMKGYGQSNGENPVNDDALLKKYLEQTRFDIDTNARAVILYEKANASLLFGNLAYHVERLIKVLETDAASSVSQISIEKGDHSYITKLKGVTYNLENGAVTKMEIDKSDLLRERVTDGQNVSKGSFPGVKKGSIVYLSYTMEIPSSFFVPNWDFQGPFPKLYSEYRITMPSMIHYMPLARVNVDMRTVDSRKDIEKFEACNFVEPPLPDETSQTWVRKNIPAYTNEPYSANGDNFIERVKIHVNSLQIGGKWINMFKDWSEITRKHMYENEDFGKQLKSSNNFLTDKVSELTKNTASELDKAQAIFSFVRDSFTVQEYAPGVKKTVDIKDLFEKKEGDGRSINLLLCAMLMKAGIKSDPVVLSTTSNEKLNEAFPDPREINYAVIRTKINNKNYFLDATVKQLPFGTLMPYCYNGYCRVVNEKCDESLVLETDSLSNKTSIMVNIAPDESDSNKLNMKFEEQFGTFSGINHRKDWQKDTAAVSKMIKKAIGNATYEMELKNYAVTNLNNPDKPLRISYETSIDLSKMNQADIIYFDPYMEKFFENNPFSAPTRKLPIEMDYLQDLNYTLVLKMPKGYSVDDYQKSTASQFGSNAVMSFKNVLNFDQSSNTISLSSKFSRKTNKFPVEDYSELRKFYGNVQLEQQKKIVFKKVK